MKNKRIHKLASLTILVGMILLSNTTSANCAITNNVYNLDEVQDLIYKEMLNRENHISFTYKGDKNEFASNITERIKKAYQEDSYTERAWLNIEPYADITNNGIQTNIILTYLTTKEQEEYIDAEVEKIINENITPNMTEIEKIRAINDYLVNRFEYDYSFSSNNPYSALTTNKTVCQGYSMSVYRIFNKLNIECDIVIGTVGQTSHSWNKIKVNDTWKYLDVTANDTSRSNRYFLVDQELLKSDGYRWKE